jgi:hypothetical protein
MRSHTTADRPTDAEVATIIADHALPTGCVLHYQDLLKARIVHDLNHLDRMIELGFPPARYSSERCRIWTPREIAEHLVKLPTKKRRKGPAVAVIDSAPVAPVAPRRSHARMVVTAGA